MVSTSLVCVIAYSVNRAPHSPDNSYEVLFNGESQKSGSLLEDFTPAVNPSKEIDDPDDKKPADWVDTKKIPDHDAKKVIEHCISF